MELSHIEIKANSQHKVFEPVIEKEIQPYPKNIWNKKRMV